MAKAEVKISVERTVHDVFAEVAQNIANEYGLKVNSVRFSWFDAGDSTGGGLFVLETSADTDCHSARKPPSQE